MDDLTDNTTPSIDYLGMLKRRKMALGMPALIVLILSAALALGLPAIYESKATILIQGQQIPKEYVSSTVETFAGQQIQMINQMVLTQDNIGRISEKFGLFAGSGGLAAADMVAMFEQNMAIELISADFNNSTGKSTSAVIAFDVSYRDPSPIIAQRVVNELATNFMEENARLRKDRAKGAEDFITAESANLDADLKRLEREIADFKEEYEGNLPSQYNFNVSTLERTERQLMDLDYRMQELEKRKIQLDAQLVQVEPSKPVVLSTGQVVLSDTDRLSALQSEYRRAAAIYNDNHPDVIRLKDEITTLQSELGIETQAEDLAKQLEGQKAYLAELRGKYTEDHQEVQNTVQLISLLESNLRDAQSQGSTGMEAVPDNPAYILLASQVDLIDSELASSTKKKEELEAKAIQLEAMIADAPQIEREYTAIQRDYDNTLKKYQELKDKQRETTIAKNLEQDQKGQRFLLIDPASAPTSPVSPNRPAIFALGLVLAFGSGIGLAFIRETTDKSIRGTGQLHALMGIAPLVAIPYIENETDLQDSRKYKKLGMLLAASSVVLLIIFIHFFYRPLDVLFYMVLNNTSSGL